MMMPKAPFLAVSLILGVLGIGGAILVFLVGSDDGIVFETVLLLVGIFSLLLGVMISRQNR